MLDAAYRLREAWNAAEDGVAPWRAENSKEAFYDTIVGDLTVSGMLENWRLARHIAGVGIGESRPQLDCETRWSGRHLVVADRWYPSNKICSNCGAVKATRPRDLAALAREITGSVSSPIPGMTRNEPAGNPCQTSPLAAGIATGRPR